MPGTKESTAKLTNGLVDKLLAEHNVDKEVSPEETKTVELPKIETEELAVIEEAKDITKESFIKLREKFKAKQKELADELLEIKNDKQKTNTDVDSLRKELLETKKRLSSYSLAEDEEYKRQYVNPIQEHYKQTVELANTFGCEENVINKAAHMPIKERIKYLQEQGKGSIALVIPMLSQLDMLVKKKNEVINNYDTEKSRLEQLRYEREKNQKELLTGRALENALLKVKQEKHPYYNESDNNTVWNELVKQRITTAKVLASSDNPEVRSETAVRAVMITDYQMALNSANERIAALEHELGTRNKIRTGSSASLATVTQDTKQKELPKKIKSSDLADLLLKNYK